jgi:hypothetical protein
MPSATRIWALDQVAAGDHFGDRMLHLDAGIDFDEIEIALRIHEKFHRAGIHS